MTKKIFRSVSLATIVVFLVSLVLIFSALYSYFSDSQINQLKNDTQLVASAVEQQGLEYLNGIEGSSSRITWIAGDGNVLYDNQAKLSEMENHIDRDEVKQAIETGEGYSKRYSKTLMRREYYSAKKLADGSVIRLSSEQLTWWALLLGMIQPIIIIVAVALILSLVLASRLAKKTVDPINNIDIDHPETAEVYEELTPFVNRIKLQKAQIKAQNAELIEKNNEAQRAEQARRDFTANVSHELKTPLQTIAGSAELLSNGMVKQEDVPEFSKKIYSEAKRMTYLVDDILNLSHLDAEASDIESVRVDLFEVAKQNADILAPAAEKAGVTISVNGKSAPMIGKPQLLNDIVYNLTDNAIKYNKQGGRVDVNVANSEDCVVLTVSDTGIGIPRNEQNRIFERFYRVDKSRSKEAGGTGLGLSIVKHAALIHKAEITLDSTPGEGTKVCVRFPKN